jgi:Peptidase family M23
MPITPLTEPSWLFVPPLELPLTLRLENGRFGALRPKPLSQRPPCASTQVVPAEDPRNPTGHDVPFINQIHEAVDLAATAGDCVFAAYSGRVADVEGDAAVTIDHHPEGLGFVTKYIHIDHIAVTPGEFIQKGMPFAAVSTAPTEPHLHFELWAVVDRESAGAPDWPGDTDLVPLDPTRALYGWEQRTLAGDELVTGPLAPQSIGLVSLYTVPFFTATFDTSVLHVPMYGPMTADERLAIDLLRDAYSGSTDVTVRSRTSPFWGVDVVTQVQLA